MVKKERLYRDRPVSVLFTLTERAEIERIAESKGYSLGSYIRQTERERMANEKIAA